jgi:hypothetical protein
VLFCFFTPTAGSRRSSSSGAAFALGASAISNLLVFVDLVMFPNVNLYRWRLATAAVAMVLLLYGLTWEASEDMIDGFLILAAILSKNFGKK